MIKEERIAIRLECLKMSIQINRGLPEILASAKKFEEQIFEGFDIEKQEPAKKAVPQAKSGNPKDILS